MGRLVDHPRNCFCDVAGSHRTITFINTFGSCLVSFESNDGEFRFGHSTRGNGSRPGIPVPAKSRRKQSVIICTAALVAPINSSRQIRLDASDRAKIHDMPKFSAIIEGNTQRVNLRSEVTLVEIVFLDIMGFRILKRLAPRGQTSVID